MPDRSYIQTSLGDIYGGVPGPDLGVPDRSYTQTSLGDTYGEVPGSDLGVPDRRYAENLGEKVYTIDPFIDQLDASKVYREDSLISSAGELRRAENTFSGPPGSVYSEISRSFSESGNLGKIYPITTGDFILESPLNLGNSKPPDKYNPSLGTLNPRDFEEEI